MSSYKKSRLVSPDYRIRLGEELKLVRDSLYYTKSMVAEMLGVSVITIGNIEKGVTINIDYYVEYAKAVGYPLGTLTEYNIEMKPLYPLPQDISGDINFTKVVYLNILESGFLDEKKTLEEIRTQLYLTNPDLKLLIDKANISSILGHLKREKLIKFIPGTDGEAAVKKGAYKKVTELKK